MHTLISRYIADGTLYHGSLISRLIEFGHSPVKCAYFYPPKLDVAYQPGTDGHVDTLQHLIFSDNYFKPWSAEHILTSLLTRVL